MARLPVVLMASDVNSSLVQIGPAGVKAEVVVEKEWIRHPRPASNQYVNWASHFAQLPRLAPSSVK